MSDSLVKELQSELEKLKAVEVADLALSPYIHPQLLLAICHEAGPTNWVVNRSDIYNETLETFLGHPNDIISSRAAEKLKIRKSTITNLTPPVFEGELHEIADHSVEDFLGHPLCPFEAILYFSQSLKEDHRASAALSLTRRVLEHPPDWNINPHAKPTIAAHFGRLLRNDSSPMVRSYCARIPILQKEDIEYAAEHEIHVFALGRVLQNPARMIPHLESVASDEIVQNDFVSNVLALDSALPLSTRRKLKQSPTSKINELIHEWYLSR